MPREWLKVVQTPAAIQTQTTIMPTNAPKGKIRMFFRIFRPPSEALYTLAEKINAELQKINYIRPPTEASKTLVNRAKELQKHETTHNEHWMVRLRYLFYIPAAIITLVGRIFLRDWNLITHLQPTPKIQIQTGPQIGIGGIQGDSNSCPICAGIHAMFTHTTAFDHLFEQKRGDTAKAQEVKQALKAIVTQLRTTGYVPATTVEALRVQLFPDLQIREFNEFFVELMKQCGRTDDASFYRLTLGEDASTNWTQGIFTTQELVDAQFARSQQAHRPIQLSSTPKSSGTVISENVLMLECPVQRNLEGGQNRLKKVIPSPKITMTDQDGKRVTMKLVSMVTIEEVHFHSCLFDDEGNGYFADCMSNQMPIIDYQPDQIPQFPDREESTFDDATGTVTTTYYKDGQPIDPSRLYQHDGTPFDQEGSQLANVARVRKVPGLMDKITNKKLRAPFNNKQQVWSGEESEDRVGTFIADLMQRTAQTLVYVRVPNPA